MYFYATSNCFKYKCNALNKNLDYDLMDFIFKKIVHWRLCYRFSVQLTDSYQKDVGCSLVLSYTGAGTPVLLYLTSAVLVHGGAKLKKKKNSHSKLMKSSPLKSYFGRIDMKYAGFKLEFITGRQKVYI